MKLDQLRYFVQIVECHSFNQAAKNLYMTQPALTDYAVPSFPQRRLSH